MYRFPTRRTFLRAAAVGGTLVPAGVLAQRAFVGGLPTELIDPAICRASFGTPVGGWRASATASPRSPTT